MPALASTAMARAAAPILLHLLLLLLLLTDHGPGPAAAVRFDYASLTLGSLRLLGDAHLKNGTIRLSRDLPVPTSGAGRALYATAVPLRGGFSTQFAFTVATLNPSSVGGGLAFVLATDGATLGDAGAYIGVSVATDAAAVEFDTLMDVQSGVASALAYLHHECERRVIHRDVKSSNVMLDEAYRARLGDFGLARQAEHGESPDATAAAGTMGYLAPEYLLTGRASECTDVFSFGALALEVACGRRPIGATPEGVGGCCSNLVEWVWSLHAEARILGAVDPRLGGEFEEGEARRALLVGLACSSPEPALRPGMRAVVQVLGGEADPPFVPAARPSMSLGSANQQLLLSLQDSVSDYHAMLGLPLSDSSSSGSLSSSSLTSTLRRGGHDIRVSSTAGEAR
uniref:Protein kinase domain-containing protein n=1 Tax=Zea mays TaxID=4577 RepID=C4J1S6_MAIZE|nr:unknown [Zea mays]